MRYKKITYIANVMLILLASVFLVMITMFPASIIKLTIGPGYYPALVSILLIISCIASIVSTYMKDEDPMIEFPGLKTGALVIGVTILFLLFWQLTREFYVVSFVAVTVLLYCLNPQLEKSKKFLKAVIISLCTQGFIYGVFQRLMYFSF